MHGRSRGVISFVFTLLAVSGIAVGATPSHRQSQEIRITAVGESRLQTLTLTSDGRIAALVAPPRYGSSKAEAGKPPVTELRILDEKGIQIGCWSVPFQGQSVGAGPAETVFVAGDGQVAQFGRDGKILSTVALPHLAEAARDTESLRARAEKLVEEQKESNEEFRKTYDEQKDRLNERIKEIEDKDPTKLTPALKRRLKSYKEQLQEIDAVREQFAVPSVEEMMKELLAGMRMINGIAATDEDLFIVSGASKGHGYAVWRMNHRFENATEVIPNLSGCCGQMDVQAHGNELIVAENTKHRVGRYDRDGKPIKTFGQRSEKSGEEEGFGGCCNPMNLRVDHEGNIYTAESEGIIRRFTPDGQSLGLVGTAKLEHGCKNVAVAVSADGKHVYFCDQPGSRIIILTRSEPASEPAGE